MERDNQEIDLPPGFRFHPTDEELITRYLSPKVLDNSFCALAIGEVDLNKVEPWDLPWMAKMGEKEWYFFCVRDRKYPTGMRTNRATDAGYWKATGKDKEIFQAKSLVGMKKTLVFYRGRAPKGEKTNWVMHEYRCEGKTPTRNSSSIVAKNEWVICRVFKKSSGGKKIHISGLLRTGGGDDDLGTSNLPPLMDMSCDYEAGTRKRVGGEATHHVTCFSTNPQVEDQKPQRVTMTMHHNTSPPHMTAASSSTKNPDLPAPTSFLFPKIPAPNSLLSAQIMPYMENFQFQFPDSIGLMQDHSVLRLLLEENGPENTRKKGNAEFSQDTGVSTDMSSPVSNQEDWRPPYMDQEFPITSAGPLDLDNYCLWNY